jgi:hypothetical protein
MKTYKQLNNNSTQKTKITYAENPKAPLLLQILNYINLLYKYGLQKKTEFI